jgi:hypothetical protein
MQNTHRLGRAVEGFTMEQHAAAALQPYPIPMQICNRIGMLQI